MATTFHPRAPRDDVLMRATHSSSISSPEACVCCRMKALGTEPKLSHLRVHLLLCDGCSAAFSAVGKPREFTAISQLKVLATAFFAVVIQNDQLVRRFESTRARDHLYFALFCKA